MEIDVNSVAQHATELGICSYKTTALDELIANQITFKRLLNHSVGVNFCWWGLDCSVYVGLRFCRVIFINMC